MIRKLVVLHNTRALTGLILVILMTRTVNMDVFTIGTPPKIREVSVLWVGEYQPITKYERCSKLSVVKKLRDST